MISSPGLDRAAPADVNACGGEGGETGERGTWPNSSGDAGSCSGGTGCAREAQAAPQDRAPCVAPAAVWEGGGRANSQRENGTCLKGAEQLLLAAVAAHSLVLRRRAGGCLSHLQEQSQGALAQKWGVLKNIPTSVVEVVPPPARAVQCNLLRP